MATMNSRTQHRYVLSIWNGNFGAEYIRINLYSIEIQIDHGLYKNVKIDVAVARQQGASAKLRHRTIIEGFPKYQITYESKWQDARNYYLSKTHVFLNNGIPVIGTR